MKSGTWAMLWLFDAALWAGLFWHEKSAIAFSMLTICVGFFLLNLSEASRDEKA